MTTTRVTFPCETCRKRLHTQPANIGKRGRCPSCGTRMRIPAAAADPTTAAHCRTPPPLTTDIAAGNGRANIPDTRSDQHRSRRHRELDTLRITLVVLSGLLFALLIALLFWVSNNDNVGPAAKVAVSVAEEVIATVIGLVFWAPFFFAPVVYIMRSVHKVCAVRRVIYWVLSPMSTCSLAYMVVIGFVTGSPALFGMYLFLLLIVGLPWYALTRRPADWLAARIVGLFVQNVRCAHCHELYPLRDRWKCGCGYVDHRTDRHVLWFSCPKCQGSIRWFDCPRCETTIVL